MAAEIDTKAKALSDARDRILRLQEQMTDRVLQMAAEIERLIETVTPAEAKSFLKTRCNLPATELSTYLGFATALKGSEDVLRTGRVSFPVLKSLVSADDETREDVLARMELGAHIDAKDVSAIRRTVAKAKLSVAEQEAAIRRKASAAAARRHTRNAMGVFQAKLESFIGKVSGLSFVDRIVPRPFMDEATILLSDFEALYGADHPSITGLKVGHPSFWTARAHHALKRFRDGRFEGDKGYGFGLRDNDLGPTAIDALAAMTGKPTKAWGVVRMPTGMAALPPEQFRPRVLELCAGAGGLALGMEQAGFHHVALIEQDRHAVATLKLNRPDWNVIREDIRKVDFTVFRKDSIDVVSGGLPCTPFSSAGEGKGKADENDLLMEGVRAVKEVAPKAFVFENVEGLLHSKHADYVAHLLRNLTRLGYKTVIHRINARDYGIPQNRHRILIVGLRKEFAGAFRIPPKFPHLATNVGDALADLMSAGGWSGADAWVRSMRERPFMERGRLVQQGFLSDTIRGRQGSAKELEAVRHARNGVTYAPVAKSAPTNEGAAQEGFLPGLTNRMRARLQDFPDVWEFSGGEGIVADQIGNAVPVGMARAVGLALHAALRGIEWDWEAMFDHEIRIIQKGSSGIVRTLAHDLLDQLQVSEASV